MPDAHCLERPVLTPQNCQEYLRTLSSSITPEDLLALPTPTSITVIGCGRPELIPMYTEATGCPFPIYAEPTRKIYDYLGMTRTFDLGTKPAYMQTNVLINSVQSYFKVSQPAAKRSRVATSSRLAANSCSRMASVPGCIG